ncbi:MAG: histidine--tRNA ligase [Xanthobacteraceae bacterium]|nr:histidine--tRNA ligase [Xanthobacteraceae bacterium]QYK45500.1 MAG: histidine--tRNA ligase [Xanthobacteraceae bacterium]
MSNDKKNKIKPRLPRGLEDRGPSELRALRDMTDAIRRVYERYGFEAVETPAIEYTEALGKFLPDSDRPNEGVFSFQDDDEQWLSLRYDLTAPLARYVAANFDALPKPYRSYRFGHVFRNEKPGPGRFRQFLQFDADTVGAASVAADAEMCMMAADTLEALGIARGDYIIKVNNRKVLDGVMDAANIAPEQRLTVLRAIDKLDRLGIEGVKQLLGAGRKDESGDFTKGAGLDAGGIDAILKFVSARGAGNRETVTNIKENVKLSPAGEEGIEELITISKLLAASDYSNRVIVDPAVVRGLEYYTGPVYEAELTFQTKDEKGNPVRFGSVGGGGRYDGLIARFRAEPVPATGFSIGVSRLLAALKALKKIDDKPEYGPVVVTVFDKDRIADYQAMVKALRLANIRAELYLGNPKNFGNQLKYADKRNSPVAVIQGGDELANGEVQIKDLIDGKKAAEAIASNAEWRASRPAQFSVSADKLVETVQEVLKRHGIH